MGVQFANNKVLFTASDKVAFSCNQRICNLKIDKQYDLTFTDVEVCGVCLAGSVRCDLLDGETIRVTYSAGPPEDWTGFIIVGSNRFNVSLACSGSNIFVQVQDTNCGAGEFCCFDGFDSGTPTMTVFNDHVIGDCSAGITCGYNGEVEVAEV